MLPRRWEPVQRRAGNSSSGVDAVFRSYPVLLRCEQPSVGGADARGRVNLTDRYFRDEHAAVRAGGWVGPGAATGMAVAAQISTGRLRVPISRGCGSESVAPAGKVRVTDDPC